METRIQRLLDGLIFVEKGLGVHVQRMLKISRGLYTGGNFKQNAWKKRRKIGDLLRHKAGQEGRGEILLENSFMR